MVFMFLRWRRCLSWDVDSNCFLIIALCEDGWTFHDSRCYFVGRTANRTQAEQICQNKNATLVTIRSHAQLYFMKTLEIIRDTWIGLTDETREGNWQWTNGDVTTITDWGLNQPDGGVLENCCVMNISDTYKWHDQPCSSITDYVCERGKITFKFFYYVERFLFEINLVSITAPLVHFISTSFCCPSYGKK